MSHKTVLKQLFPIELGENHDRDMTVEGDQLDQVQASAEILLANIFPDTAFELLYDWERLLGLSPDADASISARMAACVAKSRETGGLSIPYFTQLAAAMGYTIEIVEPQPFMAGIGAAGDIIYDADIIWCWRVDIPDTTVPVYYFRAGESGAGDSIMSFGATEIEGVFEDLKPADTFVYFRHAHYEDFTIYIEQDVNSHITVEELAITFEDLTMGEDAWVRKDFGIDYFSGDFTHQLMAKTTGFSALAGSPQAGIWVVSNIIDDLGGIALAGGDLLALIVYYVEATGEAWLVLREVDSGSVYNTLPYLIQQDTEYYLTIHRDESAGSFGTLYCYVYSDHERAELLVSGSLVLHTAKKDFRYLFGLNSYNNGDATKKISGVVSHLKLVI